MKKTKIYALYRGDTFIDLGTKKYLAELMNVSIGTITYWGTPTNKKRMKKNNSKGIIVIPLEDEEEDAFE